MLSSEVGNSRKIFAIILAYNAESLLKRAYQRIPKELVHEILVFDDSSTDETVKVALDLGLQVFTNSRNLGYGGNLKVALRKAFELGADYVVEVHGDGAQFNPAALKDVIPLLEQGFDLILGSRFQEPSLALKNGMSWIRFFANRILSFFDRLVLNLNLTEFHTGFRVYGKDFIKTLPLANNSDNFLFSFEVIAQAAYFDLRISEVAVEADYHHEHSSIGLWDSTKYAIATFVVLAEYHFAKKNLWYSSRFPKRPSV